MLNRNRWIEVCAFGAALAFSSTSAWAGGADAPPVAICVPGGSVASLTGTATATSPGGAPRGLACGDSICVGDSIATGAGSNAGLLVGNTLVQLGPDSTAAVGRTPDATADVELTRGGVRMIDPAGGAAPARLTAAGASGNVGGNDVQGNTNGGVANFCAAERPLTVSRGAQSATLAAGECVSASGAGLGPVTPAGANAAGAQIAALQNSCNPSPTIGPLAHLDPLPIVASPPGGEGPELPPNPLFPPPTPCEDPGVACSIGPTLTEQEPTGDGFPGGGGAFDPTR